MKKILITGANSYIGVSFENYLNQWPQDYRVDTVDMIDGSWRSMSFAGYDAVFHVAGIAHVRETKDNEKLFYTVNRDLAVDTAKKAKEDGVGQFIFMSSMSVYGLDEGVITPDTPTAPKNHYGRGKLEAEVAMAAMRSENFAVAIMRPPMVYGEGCKGNYQRLTKIATKLPVFPDYPNRRSMLHIDGLIRFVKNLVDERADGLFFPQDDHYTCTSQMVLQIAQANGRKIRLLKCLNPLVDLAKKLNRSARKAFGDLIYE